MAETLKPAVVPGQLVMLTGALETTTFSLTVRVALPVTELPHTPFITTLYVPASAAPTAGKVRLLLVWPVNMSAPFHH